MPSAMRPAVVVVSTPSCSDRGPTSAVVGVSTMCRRWRRDRPSRSRRTKTRVSPGWRTWPKSWSRTGRRANAPDAVSCYRLGRNLLEGLIVLNDLFQRGIAVKVLVGIAAGEHTQRSLILVIALALSEDRRRDIVAKTKNGLEAARRQGRVGGRRPVVDDDKRAAILACRARGESIRTIAAGAGISIGVVHKTLTQTTTAPE